MMSFYAITKFRWLGLVAVFSISSFIAITPSVLNSMLRISRLLFD